MSRQSVPPCHLMTAVRAISKGLEKKNGSIHLSRAPISQRTSSRISSPQRQTLMANGCFFPSRIGSHLLVQQCQNFALDADELWL